MATIEQSIALSDGVTPQFQKMAKAAEATTGKFEKAAMAANQIENAVPHATAVQIENIGAAAYASAAGFNSASTSANNLKNNVNNISGIFNRIRDSMRNAFVFSDGITPQFKKLEKGTDTTIGKFEKAAAAANRIENAISITNVRPIQSLGMAAYSAAAGLNLASIEANKVSDINYNTTQMKDLGAAARSAAGDFNAASGGLGKIRNSLDDLLGKFILGNIIASMIANIAEKIAEIPGELTRLSDEYSGIVARIKLITSSQEQAVALNDQIYYSALRARGSYSGMADAVAKIGLTAKEAFPDPQVIVPFVENIQKLFTVGGTGLEQQKDAMLQLTQALGSGKLQGDEFRSIAEAAPMVEQIVAHFMGVTQGQLKQLSSDGKITADIMKNAILGATDEINAKFASMPMTWGQVWQNMQTVAFRAFVPVFNQISAIANSEGVKAFGETMQQTFIIAGQAVAGLINNIRWLSGEIGNFYAAYQPVFSGIGTALLYVAAVWALYEAGVISATVAMTVWSAVTLGTQSIGILAMMVTDLVSLFYALGIAETYAALSGTAMWFAVILPVALVIAAIYLIVAAVNHFAGTSISATGIVVGVFFWLGGMIYNVFAFVWNIILGVAEFLGNVFKNPTAAIYNLFLVIWNGIVELVGRSVNEIIGLINKIPGMEVGFVNWGKGLASKIPISGGVDLSAYSMDYSSGNFMKGDDIGARGLGGLLPSAPSIPQAPSVSSGFSGEGAGDIGQNTKDTADNTGKVKEAMEITDEDIKYLRDIAEQEVINKYTTAEVKIEMGGIHNNVSSDTDIDGMVRYMNDSLFDAMNAGAEKVHP